MLRKVMLHEHDNYDINISDFNVATKTRRY